MYIYRDLPARLIDHSSTHFYQSIDISIVLLTYLLIRPLALFLLFWLGSASDHRSRTPTTTLFQYSINRLYMVLPVSRRCSGQATKWLSPASIPVLLGSAGGLSTQCLRLASILVLLGGAGIETPGNSPLLWQSG